MIGLDFVALIVSTSINTIDVTPFMLSMRLTIVAFSDRELLTATFSTQTILESYFRFILNPATLFALERLTCTVAVSLAFTLAEPMLIEGCTTLSITVIL